MSSGVEPTVVDDPIPSSDPNHDADAFFADENSLYGGGRQSDGMVDKGDYVDAPQDDDTLSTPAPAPKSTPARGANGKFAKAQPKAEPKAQPKAAKQAAKAHATKPPAKPAAAPPVEESATDDSVAADPLAGWDEKFVSEAESRGLTREDLADVGDPELARKMLVAMDRKALAELRKGGAAPAADANTPSTNKPADSPAKTPSSVELKPAAAASTDPPVDTGKPSDAVAAIKAALKISADDFPEEIVDQFNAINDHYAGHLARQEATIQQLNAMVQSLVSNHENTIRQQLEDEADAFFDTLPDPIAEQIGKGRSRDLSVDDQLNLRRELFRDALDLQAIARNSGRKPMGLSEALQRASDARFSNLTKTIARREVAEKVSQRRVQSVARPTQRSGPTSGSPEDNAVAFVNRFLEENGVETEHENELSVLD